MPGNLLDPLFLRLIPLAMGSDDKLAMRSTAGFLVEFVGRGRAEPGQAAGAFVDAVVARLGEATIAELMVLISGRAPRSLVQQLTDLLLAFWAKYPTETRAVVAQWLERYAGTRVGDADKRVLLKKLSESTKHPKRFREAAKEWSSKCRGLVGTAFGDL
ncbi:hypothetical protein DFJ74DRAFT_692843 [Hyaloraphidium curvatum]|nr:hypothetical protein DFJ74DRAFT_692843 [Hyaloraphidium curvatum]